MAWAKNGTPTTLGSAGDDLDITDLSANKFNLIMAHIPSDASVRCLTTLNNDTNSVYARRGMQGGSSESTSVSQANWDWHWSLDQDFFFIAYLCSISGEEKLLIMNCCRGNAAGAGTAPNRHEFVGKYVPSPDADVTRIDINNNNASNDYHADSNLTVIGSDGTEELNVQDGAIYYDTDLNKEYVLYNNTWTEL